jgi:hypothetical protein
MDRFATPSECLEQPALCRTRADERLRAVWISMALIWTGLALKERLQRLNALGGVSDTAFFDNHNDFLGSTGVDLPSFLS